MIDIFSHRCAQDQHPGNTLQSALEIVKQGATGFEFDVVLTADHEPVVVHPVRYNDDRLPRFIDSRMRRLQYLSWREVGNMRFRGAYRIPHLAEMLDLGLKQGVKCFVEPKMGDPNLAIVIARMIAGSQDLLNCCSVITFAAGRSHLLGLVKEVDQRITTNAISINPWGDWCARAAAHHADEITLGWKHVNHWRALDQIGLARLARKVRDIKGRMKVMAGNADNPDEVRWLLEAGITQIFTNRVSMVKRIVG